MQGGGDTDGVSRRCWAVKPLPDEPRRERERESADGKRGRALLVVAGRCSRMLRLVVVVTVRPCDV